MPPAKKVARQAPASAPEKPSRTTTKAAAGRPAAARPAAKSATSPPGGALEIPRPFASVVRAFTGIAGVTVGPGWGRGGVVLKRGGKIFAMLVRGQFVAKLPGPRVDALVAGGAGVRFDPRRDGRVMKEWLVVDVAAARQWSSLAREAFAFAAGAR
ncbi:MAG TPA: hypothetical protein VHM31_25140 [Polyangia bacterium]|nr:hypothetical protein [Polyangia bacterium]